MGVRQSDELSPQQVWPSHVLIEGLGLGLSYCRYLTCMSYARPLESERTSLTSPLDNPGYGALY